MASAAHTASAAPSPSSSPFADAAYAATAPASYAATAPSVGPPAPPAPPQDVPDDDALESFKAEVRTWLEVDNSIRTLRLALAERREAKRALTGRIHFYRLERDREALPLTRREFGSDVVGMAFVDDRTVVAQLASGKSVAVKVRELPQPPAQPELQNESA